MDADINRWRTIGATTTYSHPLLRTHFTANSPHSRIAKGSYKTPPSTNSKMKKAKQESLGEILDRFSNGQKRDVLDLSGTKGHLNAQHANKTYQMNFKPKPALFGQNKPIKGKDDLGVGEMVDVLEKFDTIKLKNKPVMVERDEIPKIIIKDSITSNPTNDLVRKLKPKPSHLKFLPHTQLFLTKFDQFKNSSKIENSIFREGKHLKHNDQPKSDQLAKYYDFISKELEANNCPQKGPNLKRLCVYAACFEQIIQEFTTYGPILAEIKNEYDRIISSYQTNEQEFVFLRTKVQKLLAQNENRMLLKFEKQNSKELQKKIIQLTEENNKIKSEMVYKLSIYACYLPESFTRERQKTDSILNQPDNKKMFEHGSDPLSIKDGIINERDMLIKEKLEEIEHLKKQQETEFVPRITKEKLEETLHILQEKYDRYSIENKKLEEDYLQLKDTAKSLETQLREKEQQYQFLVAEYSELNESINKNKDNV
ncbi:hypothetical protein BC833DRAFT_650056 [Globomyces pollinis-pini]|nr:hypothetical protein BC833DRAFT_650056 [Globomyces pollinis-pini]